MQHTLSKGMIVAEKFEIQFPAGGSAFTESYRAKDTSGSIVRLELIQLAKLPSSFFDGQGDLLQISLLRSVQHSNLPKLIESGKAIINRQPFIYLTFEFVSGETLTSKLQREAILSSFIAVPLVVELLRAIDYLHTLPNPVTHNSITPDSVLLDYSTNEEKPVILYFEQARYLLANPQRLAIDQLSLFHAAPEVLNGVYCPQSDLFSVGTLLYQLLIGLPPWYDAKLVGQSVSQAKDALESLRTKPLLFALNNESGIDEHLQNIIRKALAINIDNRFQSASDFIKVLQGDLSLETIDNTPAASNSVTQHEHKVGGGFDQIAGMAELKETLYNDVIRALHEKELYASYGVSIPNGMLLYGPPGCGKTFIAQKFAEEVGFNFVMIKPSDLQSKYINATQENIGKLFQEAEEQAPTILFFDELDALVPSREGELHHMHAAAVNEFLAQMTNCGDRGIFVIGATNQPNKIDKAIMRTGRLDKIVYLPPPDYEARKSMFELYLKNRPVDLGINYSRLAEATENRVSSDIKYLIDEMARKALNARSRITMAIFDEVLRGNRPSVSLSEIRKYELIKQNLENING